MKFRGEPGSSVITHVKNCGKRKLVDIGRFDENGILETQNRQFMELLKNNFPAVEEQTVYTCKTCGKEFTDRIEYMRHCKQEKKK